MAAADHEEEELTLASDSVVSKYRMTSDVANKALQGVLSRCKPGADVLELCQLGDKLVEVQCAKTFKSAKSMPKGLAFPTCVSVNHVLCHNSPIDAGGSSTLAAGDIVKVDIGAHIDGFVAVAAHTGLVTEDGAAATVAEPYAAFTGVEAAAASDSATAAEEAEATDASSSSSSSSSAASAADVVTAAHVCAELALRLVSPGNTNTAVTKAWARVAEHFGVNVCQGTLSHELKQFVIDGANVILARESKEDGQVADEFTFEKHQAYGIDIAISSGDGKPKPSDARTTVFKRDVERSYGLKMEASRWLMRKVQEEAQTFPFCLRNLGDDKQARTGVRECEKHGLIVPYPVLQEKPGDVTAHFKFTAMLLGSGTLKATGLDLPEGLRSEKLDTLPDDLKAVLGKPSFAKKSKKKNKKKKAAAAASADE